MLLTVLGPSKVSIMALCSEWYGSVLEPSTVSRRLIPLTVLGPSTVNNLALYSEWYGPVLGPSTVSGMALYWGPFVCRSLLGALV